MLHTIESAGELKQTMTVDLAKIEGMNLTKLDIKDEWQAIATMKSGNIMMINCTEKDAFEFHRLWKEHKSER